MITLAAIRIQGKIYTGRLHCECLEKCDNYIVQHNIPWDAVEQGFVDDQGKFYSRTEATNEVIKNKQETRRLHAFEVKVGNKLIAEQLII